MSNEPVDELLEGVIDGPLVLERIEAHLDAFPFPVDEGELDAGVDRLEARMGVRAQRRWPLWPLAALAVAAALLLVLSISREPVAPSPMTPPARPVASAARFEAPVGEVQMSSDARLELVEPTRIVTVSTPDVAVVLVEEGTLKTAAGVLVPERHWLVMGSDDGRERAVVFQDGTRPPTLNPDIWPTAEVDSLLQEARARALPDATRDALSRILKEQR